jgi:membrane protein YdbS with pleckstrin-like domain
MKIFNIIMVVGIIIFVLVTVYTLFIKPSLKKRR